ncbi:9321_t:CDS:2 [Paraglomus brasilianum]|uniref:9321_t:CDS:1 n=1 Tax=Paraglomus brasilianum TaxID=144538 RepID=A0A9N9CPD0_9GLOM|nr:9321_t:CDS:2 [Paraglomus brasilianum]
MASGIATTSAASSNTEVMIPSGLPANVAHWKRAHVQEFLGANKDASDLDDEDIDFVRQNKIAGVNFLKLTGKKLERWGVAGGSAERIIELVEKLKVNKGLIKRGAQQQFMLVEEIIEDIVKLFPRSQPKNLDKLKMPLMDRDVALPVTTISRNVNNNLKDSRAKVDYSFLVKRAGAKSCSIISKIVGSPPAKWTVDSQPHFEYIYLDFGNSCALENEDYNLNPAVLIGLRVAYAYFICGKYEMSFGQFQMRATPCIEMFNIGDVFTSIRRKLSLQDTQHLFIFLHIDEFQMIDTWSRNSENLMKPHFKNIISKLAQFMFGPPKTTFVQTFLSGTAPQAVIATKEASKVSFEFVPCPLLSTPSMVRIVDHYARIFNAETFRDGKYKWKLCRPLLYLLEDTGGLPRALQHLLDICFHVVSTDGCKFFRAINDHPYGKIFEHTKARIQQLYNIYKVVEDNRHLALELVRHSIEGITVTVKQCLDQNDHLRTIENLEKDAHIILSRDKHKPDQFFIKMPFLFICLYNDILHIIPSPLEKTFFDNIYWQEWELFVAHHEAFRTNLFYECGIWTLRLRDLYHGAYGKDSVLDIVVKLKKLSVCLANEQFPSSKLTNKANNQAIEWEDGSIVIVNGVSAQFGDSFVVRETNDGTVLLMVAQDKLMHSAGTYKLHQVFEEIIKNTEAILYSPENILYHLVHYRLITVFFITQPYEGDPAELPDNCLLIASDNFEEYFGPVFSARAAFAFSQSLNPNFAEPRRMSAVLPGISEQTAKSIISKRPYYNEEDFYKKNSRIKKESTELSFYPFNLE